MFCRYASDGAHFHTFLSHLNLLPEHHSARLNGGGCLRRLLRVILFHNQRDVPMSDTTAKKVDASHSPEGELGQDYLVSGKKMALRRWTEEPGEAADKEQHERPYETAGYVVEGRAKLHLEGQTLVLEPGDSWIVPEGA